MDINTPLERVKGVGEKTAEQLRTAGLLTVLDLITFLPRAFEDYSATSQIVDIAPGKITVKARVEKIATRTVRRGMRITTATLVDDSGKLQAVWFNQPYRVAQLGDGKEHYFSGEYTFSYNRYSLQNPSAELVTDIAVSTDRIVPIYRSVRGLKSQLVRKLLTELKPVITMLPEILPPELVKKEGLLERGSAYLSMHFPKSIEDIGKAKERIAFEELFQLILASGLNKQANAKLEGWHVPFDVEATKRFVTSLPFPLTGAQRRAAWDILQDFEKAVPMNRLLQGDVGAGKTVVAGLAAYAASMHGFQSAIMAPTEILATQHAATLDRLLSPFGVEVVLLTGSVKGAARKALYEALQTGRAAVAVGTHALIQEGVAFHKLGFVTIDEQHRFGVAQRQQLLKKSAHMPHLLSMTATPIPRSLALTVYGELDVSILDELPAGRKKISTKIWSPTSRPTLYANVDDEIKAGRQAYVVCSLIEDGPEGELKSVQAEYERLRRTVFRHRRIGLLHGKMKADEKDRVMSKFKAGEFDILVSTTVIEVGVDVPNATVMIIEDADRFGLSQLHQLRGRVGRSDHQSYCFLVTSSKNAPSLRLRELERSGDGFYLAEVDLKMRGPGEIYGRSQHGALNLQIATLADTKMIARARRSAKWFVTSNLKLLDYKELNAQVRQYQRLTTLN
jgi:ATP-dependent DNA helicase RecG